MAEEEAIILSSCMPHVHLVPYLFFYDSKSRLACKGSDIMRSRDVIVYLTHLETAIPWLTRHHILMKKQSPKIPDFIERIIQMRPAYRIMN